MFASVTRFVVVVAVFLAVAPIAHADERLSPDECRSLRERLATLNLSKASNQPDTPSEGLLRLELERELRRCPALEVLSPAPRRPTPAANCRTVTETDGSETTICGNR